MPAAPRLADATLAGLSREVRRPAYDRARLSCGIVHLGVGAFFQAHLAAYLDDMIEAGATGWAVTGASLRSPGQRDRLMPQDCLYTATAGDRSGLATRLVGCLREVIVAAEAPGRLLAAMSAPTIRVVSLTVTEKGYCHDPATRRLDPAHPELRGDLERPHAPRTAIGLIVEALRRRNAAGHAPFTVLCCDNLPDNGRLVGDLTRDLAALRDDRLAGWIARNVAFPATMVDRVVPALGEAERAEVSRRIGLRDDAAVLHEPFAQWVVEDRFVDGARPPLERAGVEMVADAGPYERMKLRLLNGAHSALAYLGYLAGHETIAEAVADEALRRCVERLWRDEIIPTVPLPAADLDRYVAVLLERFANPAIRHRTWQVAMDGSQKLPQRLLDAAKERRRQDGPVDCLCLAIAAWIRYVGGTDEGGRPIDVRDPLAGPISAALAAAGDDPGAKVAAALAFPQVFDGELAADPVFRSKLVEAFERLMRRGARMAAAEIAA